MRNLYFRLGALLVLATTAACSPSIEEVQKQVRADLEKTYKSTDLKVASLALKKVDDDYEGSLQTNEKGGSFSYTVKVRYKDDRPETSILPTAKTAERKLLPILNEQQREFGRQIKALKINLITGSTYSGIVQTVPKIKTNYLTSRDQQTIGTHTFCKFDATAKREGTFDYKFRFDDESVRLWYEDYLSSLFTDDPYLRLMSSGIRAISERQYEVTALVTDKSCRDGCERVAVTNNVWLSEDRCEISFYTSVK